MSETSEFWFVRHGQTDWNLDHRLQGHIDIPLNETGKKQAIAAAKYLKNVNPPFDNILSSDLGRAVETAQIIQAELQIPSLDQDSALREHDLGCLQGHKICDLDTNLRKVFDQLRSDPEYVIPGGESSRAMFDRVVAALEALPSRFKGKRVLVSTHGGWLFHVHRYISQLAIERSQDAIPNACICIIKYNPTQKQRWTIQSWGLTDHLKAN